jgi:hypothetical protein
MNAEIRGRLPESSTRRFTQSRWFHRLEGDIRRHVFVIQSTSDAANVTSHLRNIESHYRHDIPSTAFDPLIRLRVITNAIIAPFRAGCFLPVYINFSLSLSLFLSPFFLVPWDREDCK